MATFRSLLLIALALCGQVRADELTMLFAQTLPPYVIPDREHKDGNGIELDLVRAALAEKGHTLKPLFVALAAMPAQLRQRKVDGAQRGSTELREADGFLYASEPTVDYRDVAISLAANHLAIYSVADLKDKSVMAFDGATRFLGAEYLAAVKANPRYFESADEKRKISQLFAGKLQVVVGDINIFRYHSAAFGFDPRLVTVHRILPKALLVSNNAVFLDPRMRDDFNEGLKQLRLSGRYQNIVRQYLPD
ncbi:MAG: transporter substrate-binding domain-containing protein [Pseudomonadota bacterium]